MECEARLVKALGSAWLVLPVLRARLGSKKGSRFVVQFKLRGLAQFKLNNEPITNLCCSPL